MKLPVIIGVMACLASQLLLAQSSNPSTEEISLRISQLTPPDAAMPENEALMVREMDRIDDEMVRATRVATMTDYKDELAKNEKNMSDISAAMANMKSINCGASPDEFLRLLSTIQPILYFKRDILWDFDAPLPDTSIFHIFFDAFGRDPSVEAVPRRQEDRCKTLQTELANPGTVKAVLAVFEDWKNKLNDSQQKLTAYRDQAKKWLDLLKQRRTALQERINAKTPAQQISNSLWIIMIVIGVFSIATILTVKLFSSELQMEWVTSGQVIQFVTVMILLSVVMALGLSGILHENTLGTLLGGIAGYVLAQGVGRAAAREVSRTARANFLQEDHLRLGPPGAAFEAGRSPVVSKGPQGGDPRPELGQRGQ
jgi:hypothetical protein